MADDDFCVYQLSGRDRYLQLVFINFNIEASLSNQCEDNYLEIRVGNDAQGQLIGKYCGQQTPNLKIAPGSALYVLHKWKKMQLHTSNNTHKYGFRAYIIDSNTHLGTLRRLIIK